MNNAPRLKRFERNTVGRDLVVGDIHGTFTRLQQALDAIGFNPDTDRLFSVGDLVDRGPESEKVLEWLQKPWFHAVQGNHEDMAIRFARGNAIDRDNYWTNGGAWLISKLKDEQHEYAVALDQLPYAIEVETKTGLIGIVHADCPTSSWNGFRTLLSGKGWNRYYKNHCMWSRDRIGDNDLSGVRDVTALIVGHTPVTHVCRLSNVFYIDTMGWRPEGRFSFIDLTAIDIKN